MDPAASANTRPCEALLDGEHRAREPLAVVEPPHEPPHFLLSPDAVLERVDLGCRGIPEWRWVALGPRSRRAVLLPRWLEDAAALREHLTRPSSIDALARAEIGAPSRIDLEELLRLLCLHGVALRVLPSDRGATEAAWERWERAQLGRLPPVLELDLDSTPRHDFDRALAAPHTRPRIVVVRAEDPSVHDPLIRTLCEHHRVAPFHEVWIVASARLRPGSWCGRAAAMGARIVVLAPEGAGPDDGGWSEAELATITTVVGEGNEVLVAVRARPREVMQWHAARARQWLERRHLSGLRIDPCVEEERLDPEGFAAALQGLHEEIPELTVVGLPDAPMLIGLRPAASSLLHLGARARPLPEPGPPWRALERLHLRDRVRALWRTQTACQAPQTSRADAVLLADEGYPMLARLLDLDEGKTVLDLGGATGRIARGLAPLVGSRGRAISIDIDPVANYRGRGMAAGRGTYRASFRCASCLALPFPDDSVDAAVVYGFTMPLHDELADVTERTLLEARRVVRRGGRVVFGYPLATMLVGAEGVASAGGLGGEIDRGVIDRLFEILARVEIQVVETITVGSPLVPRSSFDELLSELCLDYLPALERPRHPWTECLEEIDSNFAYGGSVDLFVSGRVT